MTHKKSFETNFFKDKKDISDLLKKLDTNLVNDAAGDDSNSNLLESGWKKDLWNKGLWG